MLDDWQENLAIITANRTKGDDLVITHLGDCLWKEKNEVRVLCDVMNTASFQF
jgi:COPII coat assembly protein SEC16